MTKSTKNTIRIISILLALSLVLMEINIIPNLFMHHFWILVISYAMLVITLK